MYSEKTFKNYIFWIQVKRVLLIILLSCIGAGLGIGIGAILKGTAGVDTYNNAIIIGLTVAFFLLSLVITAGTGKEVQDGYWKIAVLRKLTAIQKTLETNNEILAKDDTLKIEAMKKMNREILGNADDFEPPAKQPKQKLEKQQKQPKQPKPVKKEKVKTIKPPTYKQ